MWKIIVNFVLNWLMGELAEFAKKYVAQAEETGKDGPEKKADVVVRLKAAAEAQKKGISDRSISAGIDLAVILMKGK